MRYTARAVVKFCLAWAGVLTAVKLVGGLEWSWWFVLLPIWAPVAVTGAVLLGALLLMRMGRR